MTQTPSKLKSCECCKTKQKQCKLVWEQRQPFERADHWRRHAAGDALIGAGRIEKAVADHPLSTREPIADDRVDMILPRNREEQRLGKRPEGLDLA